MKFKNLYFTHWLLTKKAEMLHIFLKSRTIQYYVYPLQYNTIFSDTPFLNGHLKLIIIQLLPIDLPSQNTANVLQIHAILWSETSLKKHALADIRI